jgi:hypothetical protein
VCTDLAKSATDALPVGIRGTDVTNTFVTFTIILTLPEKKMTNQQQITLFIIDAG